ncbi:hypothetical protein ACFWZ4_04035 [Frateuria sp. GZRe12]|uniref:hypothetical protein n=1 Tax=Frateuria sp. GZRe12 TaxID=3351533 RepID=UPI003EDC2DF2
MAEPIPITLAVRASSIRALGLPGLKAAGVSALFDEALTPGRDEEVRPYLQQRALGWHARGGLKPSSWARLEQKDGSAAARFKV